MTKLTEVQREALGLVISNNWITIYTLSQRSFDRYGPLYDLGFVNLREVEIDEQETALRVTPTPAGRAALKEVKG